MTKLRAFTAVLSLTILLGVTSFPGNLQAEEFPNPPEFSPPETRHIVETRAFIISPNESKEKGVETKFIGLEALAAAVLPHIIDEGVDLLASAIREASKEQEATATAVAPGYFYKVEAEKKLLVSVNEKRLIIVRGMFGPEKPGADSLWKGGIMAQRQIIGRENNVEVINEDIANEIHLYGEPEFYYEGVLLARKDEDSLEIKEEMTNSRGFMVKSKKLICNQFLKHSRVSPERDVVISLAFKAPFKTEKADAFAVGILKFENLRTRTELNEEALTGHNTGWLSLMPIPEEDDLTAGGSIPFNIDVTITETRDANKFLGFVADVLDKSKDELKNVIKIEVVGEKKSD